MPRTTKVESPSCPPFRALTTDVLGLVKVIETRGEQSGAAAKVVERWGDPDSSKSVVSASILDREKDPLLGVARKSGLIDVISVINGDLRHSIPNVCQDGTRPEDDPIVGLHLFKKQRSESSTRSCTSLTCTTKGYVRIESFEESKSPADSIRDPSPTSWNVCGSGNILCSNVEENENYALFGGKGVEVNVWDLQKCTKIWTAKSPPRNSLDIFTPMWFTSTTFLSKDDHRKFVAGTSCHQVRLYDISAQRRPVMSFDFRETPIKAVVEDLDGHTVYIGNGSGDLASVDIRAGKLLGCFIGKCSGSIRSLARHPELPIIASCGLDSYLRIWDIHSRQLLSAVFLKQHLTNVVFDSHFRTQDAAGSAPEPLDVNEVPCQDEDDEAMTTKRKKTSKGHGDSRSKKKKSRKTSKED
ncbi:WD repeat-containing protein 74 isoform X1 [Olea europaea var. sylvestris]|uniref:WD repeat-containing protein 74 isoform X1 n=1 Tax=Olea europaea var. sylvestris TaxID=158386 RepID=UPI000C1CDBEA|nr:WD repeat-containing protein 74 isoform X1 [Olea europaea var. sylvestris]